VVLLGLLLILIAAGLAVWLVAGSQSLHQTINLNTPGFKIGMTPLALMVAGAVILLVFWLGWSLIRASVRRRRRPVRESKEEQRRAELEENIRADERSRAEEAHRTALTERDKVRDEEFESQLNERDRLRDEDERRRLAEAEQNARADERARVEEEFRHRSATAGSTGGLEEAAGGGAAVGTARHRDPDAVTDGDLGTDPTAAETTRFAPEGGATHAEHASDGEGSGHTERFRTVADKLMGRGPTDEA
jgi:membrane protein implicated in regulation of membrane protease activity